MLRMCFFWATCVTGLNGSGSCLTRGSRQALSASVSLSNKSVYMRMKQGQDREDRWVISFTPCRPCLKAVGVLVELILFIVDSPATNHDHRCTPSLPLSSLSLSKNGGVSWHAIDGLYTSVWGHSRDRHGNGRQLTWRMTSCGWAGMLSGIIGVYTVG